VNIRPEKAVNVFPLTMVSNRIEDGDDVDVFDLFVGFVDLVKEVIKAAATRKQIA
jgi:hypothetical protein